MEESFWHRVDKTGDCWNWLGSKDHGECGLIVLSGGDLKIAAHRASWILHFGDIEDGKNVLRRCGNKLCVKPDHLFLGTRQERPGLRKRWSQVELTLPELQEQIDYDRDTGLFTWKMNRQGVLAGTAPKMGVTPDGYVRVTIFGRTIQAHRLAWFYCHGEWPPTDIDHVNGDRVDNRIENLRIATRSQNLANSKKRRSGLKGVYFHKTKQKWGAKINVNKKVHSLGYHTTEEAAHAAYCAAAVRFYGEFARFE